MEDAHTRIAREALEAAEEKERQDRERERAFFLSTQDNTSEDGADDYHNAINDFEGGDDSDEGDPDDYF